MTEYGIYFIIYGYALPLYIMLIWMSWRVYSDLKKGERYISCFFRECWPLLIPGVSLWGVCTLLMIALEEGSYWIKRLCKTWSMGGYKKDKEPENIN
jgi:hypothetical protein